MSPVRSSRPIPGVSGKRIPGRVPSPVMRGGFMTNVPFQASGSSVFREAHRQQVRDVQGRFAGGWGFAWQGLDMLAQNLEDWERSSLDSLEAGFERIKDEMVAYMKANAPWQDHPGENQDARENLQGAVVKQSDSMWTIMLGHGENVYYGIWLEVRWGGQLAIVLPTIMHFAPEFGQRLRTLT